MEIDTQYAARLFFPASAFVQVYLEAVANAFDAGATDIHILINTEGGIDPGNLEITITDNGEGFTDARYDRFRRLQEPHDSFHKGLGRLVYLQYFQAVDIVSSFGNGTRTFVFSNKFRGESKREAVGSANPQTRLHFHGFQKERLRTYGDIKPETVKQHIIDHFLPLLHGKRLVAKPFTITIELQTTKPMPQYSLYSEVVAITAEDLPTFETVELRRLEFGTFGRVQMSFSIRQVGASARILTAASIDGRTVPINLLPPKAVPPGWAVTFIFDSEIFQGASDSSRQRIVLPDFIPESDLYRALREEVASVLSKQLPEIEDRNKRTRIHFEERYPHLAGLFDRDTVGIVDREDAIKTAQWRFFEMQRDVLEGRAVDDEAFRDSLELSARTLLEYILYREFIIARLAETTESDKEKQIHNLIAPQYKAFEGVNVSNDVYSNNVWLLDDKFMSFRTVLSERRIDELIRAITLEDEPIELEGRPDISLVFSADPDREEAVDVVIVEVKRKGVDDKDGPYAATQLLKRARKLVDYCPNIQRMWYFGIIDIDDELAQVLQDMKWTPLFSKGQIYYQDFRLGRSDGSTVLAPTCLLSFDAVIHDAKARNHAFLEILKADVRRAAGDVKGVGEADVALAPIDVQPPAA